MTHGHQPLPIHYLRCPHCGAAYGDEWALHRHVHERHHGAARVTNWQRITTPEPVSVWREIEAVVYRRYPYRGVQEAERQ